MTESDPVSWVDEEGPPYVMKPINVPYRKLDGSGEFDKNEERPAFTVSCPYPPAAEDGGKRFMPIVLSIDTVGEAEFYGHEIAHLIEALLTAQAHVREQIAKATEDGGQEA